METLELYKELEAFVEAIDSFPTSDEKSMFYDSEKLLSIREFDLLKVFFGESEHKKALRLIHKAQEAVKSCKFGDLEFGYNEFQEVQEKSMALSENAHQYVQLYYLSGMAYYYYRKGNYSLALEFTWKEIKETELLEADGAITLHYRRVGHIYNAIKLLHESGKYEEATKWALGDLLYTLNGDTSIMPKGNWNTNTFDFIPYLRQRHFDKSFLSIVEFEIEKHGNPIYGDSFFYQNIFAKIPEFEVTNNNSAMIYNWLYLQKMYHQNLHQEFINSSIEFCQEQFDYTFDLLKLSLVSKIIVLLKKSNIETCLREKSNTKINEYIQLKLKSKQPLKENICHLIFE